MAGARLAFEVAGQPRGATMATGVVQAQLASIPGAPVAGGSGEDWGLRQTGPAPRPPG